MDLMDTSTLRGADAWRNRETEIKARLTEIDATYSGVPLPQAQRDEAVALKELLEGPDGVRSVIRELDARADMLAGFAGSPTRTERPGEAATRTARQVTRTPEDIHDLYAYRTISNSQEGELAALRDGAMREIERAVFPHPAAKPDRIREHISRLLVADRSGELARYILATSHPLYMSAFSKLLYGRPVSSEQARAVDQVQRAIATVGTTTTGGYAISYTFDPTLMLTSDGSSNPLRQIARVETVTTGNTWKGVTTEGLTISRGPAEAQAVTESSPTLGQPSVTVQPVKAEIDFSIEADEDWPQLQAEMARIIQDGKDAEEAESFVNGVGTTVFPEGVVEGLASTSLVGTTGDGFTYDDIGRFLARVPDRFEPNMSVMGHRAIFNAIDDLQAALGFGRSIDQPGVPSLKGYPRYNSSAMSSTYDEGDDILLAGDFRQGFIIVDKVGLSIEVDPHVRDGNGKWTGQRALLAHWRNSSLILIDNAFRLLRVGVVTTGV